jgi:hypothetical protein
VYEYTGAYTYGEQQRGDQLSKVRMEEWESGCNSLCAKEQRECQISIAKDVNAF